MLPQVMLLAVTNVLHLVPFVCAQMYRYEYDKRMVGDRVVDAINAGVYARTRVHARIDTCRRKQGAHGLERHPLSWRPARTRQ
jgi:hypothetical protein